MSIVYPEQGEIVIATVKKVMEFGAFCTLDEFNKQDAFIHISEVSSGWVRNVRDHVKEGQRIVVQVIRIDKVKDQIDLSLKRVNEAEKKRKMEAYNLDKRALKLIERVAVKLGKKPQEALPVIEALKENYEDLYSAFEIASAGEEVKGVAKQWSQAISEVAKQEIKPKIVVQRTVLKLKCFDANGVSEVKKVLKDIESLSSESVQVGIRYVGAPVYYIDLTAGDYKTADKFISKIEKTLFELPSSFDWSLNKEDKK